MNQNQLEQSLNAHFSGQIDIIANSGDIAVIGFDDMPSEAEQYERVLLWCAEFNYKHTLIHQEFNHPKNVGYYVLEANSKMGIWNVASTSGSILNDTPISGSESAATAWMKMMYNHCQLKPANTLDLSLIEFVPHKSTPNVIQCKYGHAVMFDIHQGPASGKITIIGDEGFPDEVVEISELMALPAFAAIVVCTQCGGKGQYIRPVDFGPAIAKSNDPVKCDCKGVLIKTH